MHPFSPISVTYTPCCYNPLPSPFGLPGYVSGLGRTVTICSTTVPIITGDGDGVITNNGNCTTCGFDCREYELVNIESSFPVDFYYSDCSGNFTFTRVYPYENATACTNGNFYINGTSGYVLLTGNVCA